MDKSGSTSFWRYDAYSMHGLRRLLVNAIERINPASGVVVDLGAESAPYRSLFATRGMRYITCDLPGSACDVTIESGQPVPLDDGSAQVVASFQVLEHVWDLDWYLGEAHRLLASDGRLLLSTHGVWPYHPHPADYRRWTREGLVKELETRGFKVESIRGAVGPLAWTTQLAMLAIGSLLCKLPLIGPVLSGVISTWAYAVMVAEDLITPNAWIDDNAAFYVVVARLEG